MLEPLARPVAVTAAPPIKLDPAGRIDEDLSCRKCGYNLRALKPDGQCPECGTAIAFAMRSDLLRFCDPEWVRKLALGASLTTAGIGVDVFVWTTSSLFRFYFAQSLSGSQLAYAFTLVVGVIALWLLTISDPSGSNSPDPRWPAGRIARITCLIRLCLDAARLFLRNDPTTIALYSVVLFVSDSVGAVAFYTCVQRLAIRLPRPRLSLGFKIGMFGRLATHLNYLISTSIWALSKSAVGASAGSGWRTANIASSCSAWVIEMVSSIWILVIMLRFRGALMEAGRLAQKSWANSHASTASVPTAI